MEIEKKRLLHGERASVCSGQPFYTSSSMRVTHDEISLVCTTYRFL